jgi:hypothetical protein
MSENPTSSEDFVNVPVPASRVQEVYALLAAPASQSNAELHSDATGWTEELVEQLFRESADPMQDMLKLLAEAGGNERSTNEIATALGLPNGARSVAGMTGAAARRANSRYGMSALPWTTRWRYIDSSDPSKGTETLIWMPKWACEVIAGL